MLPRESARALGAGALASLGAALGEWIFATPRPALLLVHLLGIDALLLVPISLLAAVALPGAADAYRDARDDPERSAGAWVLAALVGVGVAASGVFGVSLRIQGAAANRTLAAFAVAAASVGATLAGALVALAARRAFLRLRLSLGVAIAVAALLVVAIAGGAALALRRTIAEIDPALVRAPTGAILGAALGGLVSRRGVAGAALAIVAVLAFAVPLFALGSDATSRRALEPGCPFASALRVVESRPFDRDHDGHALLLGGSDCNDGDRRVFPGAREIPGDLLDQDCDGRDLPVSAPVPVPVPDPRLAQADPAQGPLSVLLVTIDTMRSDHVGAYGYPRATTPNLDALAASGTRFEWAYAQGPNTKSSVPSVLTGLYFSEIRRTDDLWSEIHERNVFFTEILADAGIHTAAFVAHSYLAPHSGLAQGFALFDTSAWRGRTVYGEETANRVADAAIAHLATLPADRPFFLWAHLFDAHFPYATHEGTPAFGDEEIDLYDGEIAFADRHLGRILEALAASPHADHTMVVVHSDHGEGLGDHGYVRHGLEVFDDIMRVPLVIRVPGAPAGVYPRQVANLDIAPTILEAMGQAAPPAMHGVSLLPVVRGDLARPHPPVLGEMVLDHTHTPRKIWVDLPWKLHRAEWLHYELLFDLAHDPGEREEVSARHPDEVRRLSDALSSYLATAVHEVRPTPVD